jgi:hypothetical protein
LSSPEKRGGLTMTMDRALCAICAWRGDCNKKFMHGDGIYCPDYTRDLTIMSHPEEKAQREQVIKDKAGKSKTTLFKL